MNRAEGRSRGLILFGASMALTGVFEHEIAFRLKPAREVLPDVAKNEGWLYHHVVPAVG